MLEICCTPILHFKIKKTESNSFQLVLSIVLNLGALGGEGNVVAVLSYPLNYAAERQKMRAFTRE